MKKIPILLTAFTLMLSACAGSPTDNTPHIGDNGNWFIGSSDTGVKAQGPAGQNGSNGSNGSDGKDGKDGKDVTASTLYQLYLQNHPAYAKNEADWLDDVLSGRIQKSYDTRYNIIFTLATIPPVLGALDSVASGDETYALIERGKTYCGIDKTLHFHNAGFDPNNNASRDFTNDDFNKMVDIIKELNVYGNEQFNFYVQDGTAPAVVAMAGNTYLTNKQYNFIMVEDGQGAYDAFKNAYVTGKTVTPTNDQPYETYCADVAKYYAEIDYLLNKHDNVYDIKDSIYQYNIKRAWGLASLDNFTYRIQSKENLKAIADTIQDSELYNALGFGSGESGFNLDLHYGSISDGVACLSEEQKTNYLTLMYGDFFEGTYTTLTRTTLSDGVTPVPAKKMIFIPGRIKSTPAMVSNASFGIGGFGTQPNEDTFPTNYAELPERFKNTLLFSNENEFNVFLSSFEDQDFLNNDIAYQGISQTATTDVKNATKIAAFNYYVDYMFGLKLCYKNFGNKYDIIMKGHPSEVIGAWQQWTNHYTVGTYRYDKMMNDVVLDFHSSNDIGKFIGMVPYGTAAENLAYLGADIALCGYPSSTYTGYDINVDVEYVLNLIDGDITADTNLAGRFAQGNLLYHDNGEAYTTRFINKGGFYKTLGEFFHEDGDETRSLYFYNLMNDWITGQGYNPDDCTIDPQGRIIPKN